MGGGLSLIGLALASILTSPVRVAGEGALPRPGIILFWATWCAPCRAELSRLPALAAAARPLPVAILALDPPGVAHEALSGATSGLPAFADGRPPAKVFADWGAPGMPLAVALDRAGRICGRRHGLLGTDQLRRWAATCSR